jgi:hypothetical protein
VLWLGSRYERDLPIRFPWVRRGRLVIRTVQRRPYVDRLNAEIRRENRASIGNPRRQLRTKETTSTSPLLGPTPELVYAQEPRRNP